MKRKLHLVLDSTDSKDSKDSNETATTTTATKSKSMAFYAPTSYESLSSLVRTLFEMPPTQSFVLVDEDGDAVALSDTLPHGATFTVRPVLPDGSLVRESESSSGARDDAKPSAGDDADAANNAFDAEVPSGKKQRVGGRSQPPSTTLSSTDAVHDKSLDQLLAEAVHDDAAPVSTSSDARKSPCASSPVRGNNPSSSQKKKKTKKTQSRTAHVQSPSKTSVHHSQKMKASTPSSSSFAKRPVSRSKPRTTTTSSLSSSASSVHVSVTLGSVRPVGPASALPESRWGHTLTPIGDGQLLLHGGDGRDDTFNDIMLYDIKSGSWSAQSVSHANRKRAWHTTTYLASSNAALVFGGEYTNPTTEQPESLADPMLLDLDVFFFYPPTISGTAPRARSGHSATSLGDHVVFFGGSSGRTWLSDVVVLDTRGSEFHWSQPRMDGDVPSARTYHTATKINEDTVVFFGGNDKDRVFNTVHVLMKTTTSTGKVKWTWQDPPIQGDLPPPRTGHQAVCVDGRHILVTGGWDPNNENEDGEVALFDDAYILDTATYTWSAVPDWKFGCRVGHRACVVPLAMIQSSDSGDSSASVDNDDTSTHDNSKNGHTTHSVVLVHGGQSQNNRLHHTVTMVNASVTTQ